MAELADRAAWVRDESARRHLLGRSGQLLERLGGPKKIVQSHFDRVIEALSPAQRDVAADVFRDLFSRDPRLTVP